MSAQIFSLEEKKRTHIKIYLFTNIQNQTPLLYYYLAIKAIKQQSKSSLRKTTNFESMIQSNKKKMEKIDEFTHFLSLEYLY